MFKAKRFLAVIVLFLFVVILGSCGKENKTDNGNTPSGISTKQPSIQYSITDTIGQVSFLSSQGQIITLTLKDEDTNEPLSNISVSFIEIQNKSGIIKTYDSTGQYVTAINTISNIENQQSSTDRARYLSANSQAYLEIPVILLKTAILEGSSIYKSIKGRQYISTKIGEDYRAFGTLKQPLCVTAGEYIDYVVGKSKLLAQGRNITIDLGTILLNLSLPISLAVTITTDFFLNPISNREQALFEDLMVSGIVEGSSYDEVIALEFIQPLPGSYANSTMATDEIIVPKSAVGVCDVDSLPSVPTNLQAVAISSTQINLSWSNVLNELGYNIEYSLDGTNFERISVCIAENITQFSHEFLSPRTTYYYRVQALNIVGQSDYSKVISATTFPASQNQNPVINSVFATPVNPNNSSIITCHASDPDGDSLTYVWNRTGGTISGTGSEVTWEAPSTAGTYTITCNVSDGKGGTDSKSIDITVSKQTELLTITTSSLSDGTVNVSYGTNLSATGGKETYIWSILSGNPPPGLSLSTGGIISGTPTTAGTYTFTAQVTDSSSPQQEAQATLTIVVNPSATGGVLSVTPGDRLDSSGTEGGPFSPSSKTYTLSNTGGASINWTASKTQNWVGLTQTSGTLAPGRSTIVTVTINSNANSLAPNTYVDIVTFTNTTNGDGDTTRTVNLTVSYTTPTLTIGPTSLNFGDVQVGTCSTAVFAIQHASGTGPASGAVSVNPNPPFSITSSSSFSVSDGSAANVSVRFCPISAGTFSGTATVSSSATFTNTNTVSLTGIGVNPTPTTGTIQVNATLNGSSWSGSVDYTLTGPGTLNGTSVPANFSKQLAGTWTLNYSSEGPTGAVLSSISPSKGQTLSGGGSITFTLNFTSSSPVDRITNGSFDYGMEGWVLQGSDFWAGTELTNYNTQPGYAAGGVDYTGAPKNGADGAIYQAVTIPSNATYATLSFWYNITSDEIEPIEYDYLYVTIRDSIGNLLAKVATLTNIDKGTLGVYSQKTFDMTPYIGQTIRVRFGATTDSGYYTVFRIDDVSLISDGY